MSLKLAEPVLINGVEWTHSDLKVIVLGLPIYAVTRLDYSNKQSMQANYGTGSKPLSVGYGTVKPNASMTVSMTEYQRLADGANEGYIQNYALFDVMLHFFNREAGAFTHRLLNCKFMGPESSSSVDNSQIEVTLEMFVADIKYK